MRIGVCKYKLTILNSSWAIIGQNSMSVCLPIFIQSFVGVTLTGLTFAQINFRTDKLSQIWKTHEN